MITKQVALRSRKIASKGDRVAARCRLCAHLLGGLQGLVHEIEGVGGRCFKAPTHQGVTRVLDCGWCGLCTGTPTLLGKGKLVLVYMLYFGLRLR